MDYNEALNNAKAMGMLCEEVKRKCGDTLYQLEYTLIETSKQNYIMVIHNKEVKNTEESIVEKEKAKAFHNPNIEVVQNETLKNLRGTLKVIGGIGLTDTSHLFKDLTLDKLDLSEFDSRNVQNMEKMFTRSKIKELDISKIDTSNVNNMNGMFYSFKGLDLDLSGLNTQWVKSMNGMFAECKVNSLDISNFDVSNVSDMRGMFYSFVSKDELDLTNFDRTINYMKPCSMREMFSWYSIPNIKTSSERMLYAINVANNLKKNKKNK